MYPACLVFWYRRNKPVGTRFVWQQQLPSRNRRLAKSGWWYYNYTSDVEVTTWLGNLKVSLKPIGTAIVLSFSKRKIHDAVCREITCRAYSKSSAVSASVFPNCSRRQSFWRIHSYSIAVNHPYSISLASKFCLVCVFAPISKCRWKGSVYRTIWRDLIVYYGLYYTLTILHNFVLGEDGKK